VKKAAMTEETSRRALGRIKATVDLDSAKQSQLVIEAIIEDLPVKLDLWKKLEGICPAETGLCVRIHRLCRSHSWRRRPNGPTIQSACIS